MSAKGEELLHGAAAVVGDALVLAIAASNPLLAVGMYVCTRPKLVAEAIDELGGAGETAK